MHLFFIDDSGSIPQGGNLTHNHFVLGGLVIPEEQWHNLEKDFSHICGRYGVRGEVKWRFFGQKIGRETSQNSLIHLSIGERDELRTSLFGAIAKYNSVKIISAVTHLPTVFAYPIYKATPDIIYSMTYKPLTERFQYHLQDLSRASGCKFNGIIVCDHRNPNQDRILSSFHNNLLKSSSSWKSKYANLVEHLFLSPSHYSIGLQFADLIAGAIFRYFEHQDKRWYQLIEGSIRKDPHKGETTDGFGLVRIPKGSWKENDAESRTNLEPAVLTQSQRTPDDI
ncbi:MAG TPA: DUF3800 domain-containing protein [Chlamydiales bacterium]|nr:DUF3800 domain-containing protein [Chlamydiales bacterium]